MEVDIRFRPKPIFRAQLDTSVHACRKFKIKSIAYTYCGSLVVNICRLGIAHLVLKTCTIQVNVHWLKKHYFVHFWFPFREYFKIATNLLYKIFKFYGNFFLTLKKFKIFTCPEARGTRKYELTKMSGIKICRDK